MTHRTNFIQAKQHTAERIVLSSVSLHQEYSFALVELVWLPFQCRILLEEEGFCRPVEHAVI